MNDTVTDMQQLGRLQAANSEMQGQISRLQEELKKVDKFINDRAMNIYMQVYTASVSAGGKSPHSVAKSAIENFNKTFSPDA